MKTNKRLIDLLYRLQQALLRARHIELQEMAEGTKPGKLAQKKRKLSKNRSKRTKQSEK